MKVHIRLGVAVCMTVFSLTAIVLLLPGSRLSTRWKKIALGSSWDWGSGADGGVDGGIRLVVFGDSWVDNTIDDGEDGKGRNWTEELCDEISCTSYLNFAASQPSKSYPASSPTGALISNNIYLSSLTTSTRAKTIQSLLPDLAAQIKEFLALPPTKSKPAETLFVVSAGIWDIYTLSSFDYGESRSMLNDIINELFIQLDDLQSQYAKELRSKQSTNSGSDNGTDKTSSPFRVIIPKLFDPTLLPGWLSQRPVPLRPSSIAEEQKNGMYLTTLWNSMLENKMGEWLQDETSSAVKPATSSRNENEQGINSAKQSPSAEKDVFYYDTPRYLLDMILEHQLEDEGLSDAAGLGTGDSPFKSVYQPCVREAGAGPEDGHVDLNGLLVCKEPEEYLFWDSFNLGVVANEGIGKQVGEMVREGKSLRKIWKDGQPKGL